MADDIVEGFAALRKALIENHISERDASLELKLAAASILEIVVRDVHDIASYMRAHND